jgi:hypothetical protein
MTTLSLVSASAGTGYPASTPIRRKRASRLVWASLVAWVSDDQGQQCLLCGHGRLTMHHKHKIADGGIDCRSNLIGLCGACHVLLHNLERHMSFRARLLTAAMVILGPSPAFQGFLQRVFPVLIRNGSGFHPALLKLRLPRVELAAPDGVAR